MIHVTLPKELFNLKNITIRPKKNHGKTWHPELTDKAVAIKTNIPCHEKLSRLIRETSATAG